MPGNTGGGEAGPVAQTAPSIAPCVAVEHLAVKSGLRHPDPVVMAGHEFEVEDEDEGRAPSKRMAHEGENAVLPVAEVYQLETRPVAVALE